MRTISKKTNGSREKEQKDIIGAATYVQKNDVKEPQIIVLEPSESREPSAPFDHTMMR